MSFSLQKLFDRIRDHRMGLATRSDLPTDAANKPLWYGLEPLESRVLMSVSLDPTGWTQVGPSSDTRVIYVSNSTGNDNNTGLSADSPVRSLSKATSLARSGMPDWILLKRGDSWSEGLGLNKAGRSASEPLLVSYYGSDSAARPRVGGTVSPSADNIAIIGLHLYGAGKYNKPGSTGLSLPASYAIKNLYLEDLLVQGENIGLNLRNGQNVTLRRSVIVDNAAQGIYTTDNNGLFVEQNVFDSNGIDPILQHNIYKARGGVNLVFRDNIFANGGNFGLKLRAQTTDAVIDGNLFVGNRNGLKIHLDSDDPVDWKNRNVDIFDNVFMDTGRNKQQHDIYIDHTLGVNIKNNILAHSNEAPYDAGIWLGQIVYPGASLNIRDAVVSGNIIHNVTAEGIRLGTTNYDNVKITDNIINVPTNTWGHVTGVQKIPGSVNRAEITYANNTYNSAYPSNQWFEIGSTKTNLDAWIAATGETGAKIGTVDFKDPGRDLAKYNASLGGNASQSAFLAAARNLSKQTWNAAFTAEAVVAYMKDGFSHSGSPQDPPPAEKDTTAPTAVLHASDVKTGSNPTWTFDVVYNDNVAINVTTIDNTDVIVTTPSGGNLTAKLVNVASTRTGATATYSITAPGGSWDAADVGAYTVKMQASQVADTSGNHVAAGSLGVFNVSKPVPQVFSDVEFLGDLANYDVTTGSRWEIAEHGGSTRMFLNSTDFSGMPNGAATEFAIARGDSWGDMQMDLTVNSNEDFAANPKSDVTLIFGYKDANNFLAVDLRADAGASKIYQLANGVLTTIATAQGSGLPTTGYNDVRLTRTGSAVSVAVNGTELLSATDDRLAQVGRVGIGSYNDSAYFDDIRVGAPGPLTPEIDIVDTTGDADDLTLTLPSTEVGQVSGSESYTIANRGRADLTVSIGISGAHPDDFGYTVTDAAHNQLDPANLTIAAGQSVTVWVAFAPTAAGARSASLNLTTNDSDEGSVVLSLNGEASAAADLLPPTAVLDEVTPVASDGYRFEVTYSDNVAIDLESLGTGDLVVTGPAGQSYAAALVSTSGSGATVTATYELTAPAGSWTEADNGTYTINLAASQVFDSAGLAAAAGVLGNFTVAVEPPPTSTDSFSNVPWFGDAANYDFTTPDRWEVRQHQGDARLMLNTTDFSGTPRGAHTEIALVKTRTYGDLVMKLSASANEDLVTNPKADYGIVFGYQDANNFLAVDLRSDARQSKIYEMVDGKLTVIAKAVDRAFTDTAYHAVELVREGTSVTVKVDGKVLMAADDARLAVEGRVGVTSYNDSVYFDNIEVVEAVGPEIDISDSSGDPLDLTLTMPETKVGSTSAKETFTLANTGGQAITISGVELVGAHAGDFAVSAVDGAGKPLDVSSFTLPAGQTAMLELTFTPGAQGERTASLTFNTADALMRTGSVTLSLAGVGTVESSTRFSPVEGSGDLSDFALLTDDRWQVIEDGGDRRMALATNQYSGPPQGLLGEYALLKNSSRADFTLQTKARITDDVSANPRADIGLIFGYQDASNYFFVTLRPDLTRVFQVVDGHMVTIASAKGVVADTAYHQFELARTGSSLVLRMDNNVVLQANDSRLAAAGQLGVGSYNDMVYFDDLQMA